MNAEKAKYIRNQYMNGKKVCDIAREVGHDPSTISRCLKGVDKVKRKNGIIKMIAEDYLPGKNDWKEICIKYNICSSTLYSYLHQYSSLKRK